MLPAVVHPGRDVLFASSLVLACVGLLPLVEFAQSVPSPSPSTAQPLARALAALAPIDRSALVVCGVMSALGAALLVLQLAPPLTAASTRRALRLALLGVGAAVVVAAAVLALAFVTPAPASAASVWRSERLAADERALERQVNDVYCHAKGERVCAFGSIADARQVFPLRQWPVGSDSQPGRRVAASCDGFAQSVRLWGYPAKMELCRLCADVCARRRQHPQNGAPDPLVELQRVVPRLSVGELMWCGEYLAQLSSASSPPSSSVAADEPRAESLAGQSPYRAHREAFRALLDGPEAPHVGSLRSTERALQVLLVASAVSATAIRRWVAQLGSLKAVE